MKKTIQHIIPIIFIAILMTACNQEIQEQAKTIPADEKEVEMALSTSILAQTTLPAEDQQVSTLDLVVCKDGVYQYTRPAYTSDYATFRSILKIDQNVDIYFLANMTALLQNATFIQPQVTTWQQIQNRLHITYTDTIINNKKVLPMWGQVKNVTISEHRINNLGKVKLLRAVASANLYFSLTQGKGMKFKPQVAYVYYGADRAFVAPAPGNLTLENGQVTSVIEPIAPQSMKTTKTVEAKPKENAIENQIYMFDNDTNEFFAQDPQNKRTRLVIGGYLEDSEILSYYPLDFFDSKNNRILDVTRNHQYNLTITAVNSQGWPDPDEAAEQAAINIDYQVIAWDKNEDSDIAIDGPDYLSVTSKYVTLYRKQESTSYITLSGTFTKEQITLSFYNSTNGTTTKLENGISNDRFKAEIHQEEKDMKLTFTALKDYSETDASSNQDTLLIQAGRINFYIHIQQITSKGWDNAGNNNIDF